MNHLYFGDCLEVLKELHAQNPPFIDLIYIDPPFNSKRNYNVLFESIDQTDSNAQKQAFADTWSNVFYIVEMDNLIELNKELYDLLNLFSKSKAVSDSAVAYLTTMAIRIWYMRQLLKETGSFYLHCDPTMSHYLKLICDIIFGSGNFRNEVSWKRSNPKSNNTNNFANSRDIILRYTKSEKFVFNKVFGEHDQEYVDKAYRYKDDKGRRYRLLPLLNPNDNRPNLTYEFLGVKKVWRWTRERMEKAYESGLVVQIKPGAVPQYKKYLEDSLGKVITTDWDDIPQASSKESLGYPTQKPVSLLERIITVSSQEGDVVADFFCGCGTTIAAAQKLNRKWLGADISHLAIKLILQRLATTYGPSIKNDIKLHGFPKDVDSAKMLARETENGRFGFQEWAIEVLLHGVVNPKKTGDGGYDGYITYQTDKGREFVLIETKSGNVNVKNMREFIQVVDKQKAAAGIFVCFDESVTKDMIKEAKSAGKIQINGFKTDIDKIQIITIDEMINHGRQPHLPNISTTFKQAERFHKKNQISISF